MNISYNKLVYDNMNFPCFHTNVSQQLFKLTRFGVNELTLWTIKDSIVKQSTVQNPCLHTEHQESKTKHLQPQINVTSNLM